MSKDTIYREDAIDEMERIMADHPLQGYEDELLLIDAIKSLPSADRPTEVIYGNEHNCIMTIFGECSYAETGCGDCTVVEKVRKALSADRPQEWIPCSERVPKWKEHTDDMVLVCYADGSVRFNTFMNWQWVQGEPIAWMPLPKPWKGADDEDN